MFGLPLCSYNPLLPFHTKKYMKKKKKKIIFLLETAGKAFYAFALSIILKAYMAEAYKKTQSTQKFNNHLDFCRVVIYI